MTDNHGYVLAPLPVAPINETDMVLFPEGLKALKKVAKEVGLDLRGAYVNLDGGFDSRANRKCIFQGIHIRRDSWVSVMYAEELNSGKSSVTLQRTDRHGSMGQKSADFQLSL